MVPAYASGFDASAKIGRTLCRPSARARSFWNTRREISTAYTVPSGQRSETWLTVVPLAAPRYRTCEPFSSGRIFQPFRMRAASLLLRGSHRRYSDPRNGTSRSPYTERPGTRFSVYKSRPSVKTRETPSGRSSTTPRDSHGGLERSRPLAAGGLRGVFSCAGGFGSRGPLRFRGLACRLPRGLTRGRPWAAGFSLRCRLASRRQPSLPRNGLRMFGRDLQDVSVYVPRSCRRPRPLP